jgi:hypothetical protein
MSRIKELKSNEENNINLIDVIELFSPDKKSKYTELLLRMMKSTPNLKEHAKEVRSVLTREFETVEPNEWDKFNDIQIMWLFKFIDTFFNFSDLKKFIKFCEYNERGVIEMKDVTTYKDFDSMMHQLELAENKMIEKELEKQVIKLYEDDEWSIVRPLSFNASKKYGSRTKWCTTNPEYFNKYTKRGILIYCICKTKLYKVAAFYSLDKNEPEFSWWNEKDFRIDSLDTELPSKIMMLIRDVVKDPNAKTNDQLSTYNDDGTIKKNKRVVLEDKIRNAVESETYDAREEAVTIELPQTDNITVQEDIVYNEPRYQNESLIRGRRNI